MKNIPKKYRNKIIKGIDGKSGIIIDRKIRARPRNGAILTLPDFLKNREFKVILIEKVDEVNIFK